MQITAEPREDYTILHLRGEFDTFYCPHLQKEIDALMAAGVRSVALNLRLVKFINSTALGAIIKASKSLGAQGGKLAISRPSAFVKDIMEKVGLDRVVPMFDSDEAAGTHLQESAPKPSRAGADDTILDDESSVLFSPADPKRVEHFLTALVAHHDRLRRRLVLRLRRSRAQPVGQSRESGSAAALIRQHPPRRPIQPRQHAVSVRHVVEPPPRDQEDIGYCILCILG